MRALGGSAGGSNSSSQSGAAGGGLGIDQYVDQLCRMAVTIHRTVELETDKYYRDLRRRNYTTPTSYLELIKLYMEILSKQRTKVSDNEKRYRVGLEKLADTEKMVAKLQEELTNLQPVLDQAARDTGESFLLSPRACISHAHTPQSAAAVSLRGPFLPLLTSLPQSFFGDMLTPHDSVSCQLFFAHCIFLPVVLVNRVAVDQGPGRSEGC